MRWKSLWTLLLALWTALLVVWTVFCRSAWSAGAAESELALPQRAPFLTAAPSASAAPAASFPDVPFLDQRENWPTGCESVSAVMALRYWGVEITVDEFIDRYLVMGNAPHWNENGEFVGCDPRRAFPGDPRTESGWGCYAPVIADALERTLREKKLTSLAGRNLSGADMEELIRKYVSRGIPVLVWVTIGMEEPYCSDVFFLEDTGEAFPWVYPMHCMVLTGRTENGFVFNDPLVGKDVTYPAAASERAYEALGRQALALLPTEP